MSAERLSFRALTGVAALLPLLSDAAGLTVLDRPLWVFPGQLFRVCLQQPAGAGPLTTPVPANLQQVDAWDQDAIQRFYFRATAPGTAQLVFTGAAGRLEMDIEVIAWSSLCEPRTCGKIALPRIWPLEDASFRELKSRRTLYADADLAALKAEPPGPIAKAWLALDDDAIYGIVPGPSVARTCLIVLGSVEGGGVGKGCPVCGTAIYEGRSGFYPWLFDAQKHPWKVGCPNCKTWFPSNDWAAGDMHSGPFPDDGFGCEPLQPVRDANGRAWRWPFIAYYHQWQAYMNTLTPGILQSAQAYTATGDRRYAHACAVALLRYAESMADMAVNLNHRKIPNRDGVYNGPVGAPIAARYASLGGTFLYIQPNWDTPRMEDCARAWDLIFDHLGDDTALLEFARARHHPEFETMADLRRFIELGVLRVPLQACLDDAIARNYPQQEVTAATLALALGTASAVRVADWLLNERGVRFALVNEYYKDGGAHESPSYNHIQIRDLARLFDTLERIRALHPDLYVPPRLVSPQRDPKFRLQYDFPLDYTLIGRTYPMVGDTGKGARPDPLPLRPGYPCDGQDWASAFRLTGDPRFALALAGTDGDALKAIADPPLREAASAARRERGARERLPSLLQDGYAQAILRSGEGDDERALWLRYGRVPQHAHPDMLTYGLAARQRDWLPEMGYPEGWTFSGHWETNWGTHYGTKIAGVSAWDFAKGELTTFAATAPAQYTAAECAAAATPTAPLRQRSLALIDLSPADFYVVTVERVRGGTRQIMSFHGPDGEATVEGLRPLPYQGTALGEGTTYLDLAAATKVDRELGCLVLLRDPARAAATAPWSLTYALRGQADLALRVTTLEPRGGDVVLAKGRAPGGRSAYDITWALLNTTATDPGPLVRQYLHVLQPYAGKPVIDRVESVPLAGAPEDAEFPALALRVVAGDVVDTLVLQYGKRRDVAAGDLHCDGEFGLWRERAGRLVAAVLVRGTRLTRGALGITLPAAEYHATIQSCDWATNRFVVSPAPPGGTALVGRHLRITNDLGSSASYQVVAVEPADNGVRLRVGHDPRLGEGFAKGCQDGLILGATGLRLSGWGYYQGKTVANEDASAWHRLDDVRKGRDLALAPVDGQPLPAGVLTTEFADRDGDGMTRYVIYDYGPGDTVTIENAAVLRVP